MSLDPETRVRVYNTAARARIALGQSDWEPLLDASQRLQQDVDPDNAMRTENYRIEALLREERFTEALALLDVSKPERGLSRWIRAAYRAAVAAERNEVWQDTSLQASDAYANILLQPSPAAARYFHQCALQSSRPLPDRRACVDRARQILAQLLTDRAPTNILWITAHALDLHDAALASSPIIWTRSLDRLQNFLSASELSAALAYYRPHLPTATKPDLAAAQRLLAQLVLF